MPLKDSFAVSEVLDSDLNPLAPKNGADDAQFANTSLGRHVRHVNNTANFKTSTGGFFMTADRHSENSSEQVVQKLRREIEPILQQLTLRAAADEHERTRAWLERSGLPKAARVAQRETYDVLRRNGIIRDTVSRATAEAGAGSYVRPGPHPLSDAEVLEFAEACVALFEAKGQPVQVTLDGMGVDAGGILLPDDVPRVLSKVEALLGASRGEC